MRYLLDTHVLLWWLLAVPKLSKAQKKILDAIDRGDAKACISVMTLWELATLHSLERLQCDFPFRDWLRSLFYHDRIEVIPLDADIIFESAQLRKNMPGDPVDQIIVASAKAFSLALLTADRNIRKEAGIPVV